MSKYTTLYVLVRKDLPKNPMHKIVQSGHAVAGYVSRYDNFDDGRMVYLAVDNEYELKLIQHKLDYNDIPNYMFYEPYWDEYTALSVTSDEKLFTDLKLLKF